MKLMFLPQEVDDHVTYTKVGDTLVVNGEPFNFSMVGEGDTLPYSAISSRWFIGPVERINGELEMTMWLPIPSNYSPEQAYPEPIIATVDGPIMLPKPLPDVVTLEGDE